MSDPTAPPPSSYDPPPPQPPSYDPPAPPPSYDPSPQPPSYHPSPQPPSYDPSPQPPYDSGPSFPQQSGGDPFGAPPVSGYPATQPYGQGVPQPGQPGFMPGQPGYPVGPPGYPPGQPGYPPAPVKGKSKAGVIIAVVVAVVLLICGGVAVAGFLLVKGAADAVDDALPSVAPTLPDLPSEGPSLPGPAGSQPAGEVPVVYEVSGDGPARLTWFDGNLSPKRAENQKLPWRMEVKLPHGRLPATVIAVRDGTGQGSISCRVLINGKETVKQEKSGPFAFVNCSDFNEK